MGNGLTLTECRDACHSAGYGFFGRENLASCHCGNAFNTSDTALVAAAECNCNAKANANHTSNTNPTANAKPNPNPNPNLARNSNPMQGRAHDSVLTRSTLQCV